MYPAMLRPIYPPRPVGMVGINPVLARPPNPGVRGPVIAPVIRPAGIPSVTPTEKPQTTVYVGKIASTVENDFILSILQLCGLVKSWKRAQNPTTGVLTGFGFCEFDSAEGVLRAIRLLSKFNIDGQELMLNFNEATKEYLKRYVEKKRESSKKSEAIVTEGVQEAEKDEASASGTEKDAAPKSTEEESKDDKDKTKETEDIAKFGLVTDEDREADRVALEKLNGMIEERLKTNPLPPPPPTPPVATTVSGTSNTEVPARSREGDSDVDMTNNDAAEDKNDDGKATSNRISSEHEKPETGSPDRSKKNDRSKDRDRDAKREKDRELDRYERERDQERVKREKEREYKIREDERRYRMRLKEWESRERDKDVIRKDEKKREIQKADDRRSEILDQEEYDSDDGYSRKRKRKTSVEERKRRQREKEDDLADRIKEEEEIAEAKRRAEEAREKQRREEENTLKLLSAPAPKRSEEAVLPDEGTAESKEKVVYQSSDGDSEHENHILDRVLQNGNGDETCMSSAATPDTRLSSNAHSRKLGFGLVGSGKRTAVPSVFHEEEDEDAQKDKKMRPLVPIDYSNEELQAVKHGLAGEPSSNLAAAAEFAKRISGVNSKEERHEAEKDRSRRSHERSSHRDRERNDHETPRTRDDSRKETVDRDKDRERGSDKAKTPENRKLFDAKQLIDTIPKTKDELFSYKINWAIYDKNELHARMRPWISKKITEYLGEEETTLVDYIVSSTQEHANASEVLDRLQAILDDEAEMFVLKMWRMLIFEIKKVETGLALRSKG